MYADNLPEGLIEGGDLEGLGLVHYNGQDFLQKLRKFDLQLIEDADLIS